MDYPPTLEQIEEIRARLLTWGAENYRPFPWRAPKSEWIGLISELLLQRTRAQNVIPVYEKFIRLYPAPENLARATVEEIEEVIFPLGLRWRAPLLQALARRIVETGSIPTRYEDLIGLPGVGPYVAAAWLSFHNSTRGVIVDSNIVRWICRMIDRTCDAETRRKKWLKDLADLLTPDSNVREYNYAVLDFTMTICTPGVPRCENCPLGAELCVFGFKRLCG